MSYYECEHGRDIGRCQECADEKDNRAEIARLRAELERVRGQRDAVAHLVRSMWRGSDLCANSEVRANVDLERIGLRIVNGKVKEIEG